MSDEGFTTMHSSKGWTESTAASQKGPVRRNIALFAQSSTKDAKGRKRFRVEGLMIVLESILYRDAKGKPLRGDDGKLMHSPSAGLPGGSIEELPDDAVGELIKAYVGKATVRMHNTYRPIYAQHADEVTQDYIIATVECERGSLPVLERPAECPDAMWATWNDVFEEHARDKRGVLRSLFVLFKAISWTQGKVPEIVREWVIATRPPLPKTKMTK